MRSCAALIFSLTMSFALPLTAHAATRIDDAEKFVRSVYAKIEKQKDYRVPDDVYSDRLSGLFALVAAVVTVGVMSRWPFVSPALVVGGAVAGLAGIFGH